jgi:hypothetical protein
MEPTRLLLVLGSGIVALLVAALVLVVVLSVPWQAHKRGHGFLSWLVLETLALNPIYPLVLLALLPDRSKARLRAEFARELDERLAGVIPPPTAPPTTGDPGHSGGGQLTTGGSIGDVPTAEPGRSIGDVETQDPNH